MTEPIRFIGDDKRGWKVAPESRKALDDQIEAALVKMGLPSQEELRKELS